MKILAFSPLGLLARIGLDDLRPEQFPNDGAIRMRRNQMRGNLAVGTLGYSRTPAAAFLIDLDGFKQVNDSYRLQLTASVGIELLLMADLALYDAKNRGRNRSEFFDE